MAQDVTRAPQVLKDFDTGGLAPPLAIRKTDFRLFKVLTSDLGNGIFEPVLDWIAFY